MRSSENPDQDPIQLSIIFFSHLTGNGYKAPRLRGYLSEFGMQHFHCRFFGMPPSPEKSVWPNCLTEYHGYRWVSRLAALGTRVGSLVGWSSLGRYLGCNALSLLAIQNGALHETDAVFTQPYMWPLVKAAKKRGIKIVLESDTDHPLFFWNTLQERHKEAGIPFIKRDPWNFWPYVNGALKSIDYADQIIVFSQHALETYVKHGVNPNKLTLATPPPNPKCQVSKISSPKPEFIWAGNHGVRKGLDLMVDAWASYKRSGGNGSLFLCGEITPAQSKLRKQLANLPDVIDLGRISLIGFLRERRRVLVSPSFSEGMPRTVLEALACGSCAIASHASCGSVVVDRESGWITELDSQSLAEALHQAERNWCDVKVMGDRGATLVFNATKNYFTISANLLTTEIKKL